MNNSKIKWDAFISHASEDKEEFVRPLFKHLKKLGLRIWFDEFTLTIGDSLRRKIDNGLSNSKYGIVVLSKAFFEKEWPQKELDGLVSKERNGRKVILPLWHGVNFNDVENYSPILADRLAISSTERIEDIAIAIFNVVNDPEREEYDEKETKIRTAQVIFTRPSKFGGGANTFIIEINGQFIQRLPNGGEFSIEIPIGRHTLFAYYTEIHHNFGDGKYGPSGGSTARGVSDEVIFHFREGKYIIEVGYEGGLSNFFKKISPIYIKKISHFK